MENQEKNEIGQGAKALDDFLKKKYNKNPDGNWVSALGPSMGGGSLEKIAYYNQENEKPHWHFVTYAFSDLFSKLGNDPENSGSGYELTFRMLKEKGEADPHQWPHRLLERIASYAFENNITFREYDYLDTGEIDSPEKTALTGALLVADPELEQITTPNGKVSFLQIVPLTPVEFEAVKAEYKSEEEYLKKVKEILENIKKQSPLLITDLARA